MDRTVRYIAKRPIELGVQAYTIKYRASALGVYNHSIIKITRWAPAFGPAKQQAATGSHLHTAP